MYQRGGRNCTYLRDPDRHSTIFELEIDTTLKLQHVTSSYEAEIIALQAGLDTALSMNLEQRQIHIFTDSLSNLQQLHTLPYKYKYTNVAVKDVAEKLAELITKQNRVELHFIPSHTDMIFPKVMPQTNWQSKQQKVGNRCLMTLCSPHTNCSTEDLNETISRHAYRIE